MTQAAFTAPEKQRHYHLIYSLSQSIGKFQASDERGHFFCPTDNIFLSLFPPLIFSSYCDDKRPFNFDERGSRRLPVSRNTTNRFEIDSYLFHPQIGRHDLILEILQEKGKENTC